MPTPTIFQTGATATALADEDGYTLTDEDGNALQPD